MLGWGQGGARPPQDAPVLDEGYLERLGRHVGRETVAELLADGLIEISDRLSALGAAAESGAREDLRRLGHDLAGLAGHLGLSALSRAAVEMNRAARAEPDRALDEIAAPVLAAGAAACQALRRAMTGAP
jgi:HPt (histidine-containing phosphotransfer) domain-containing protein